MKYTNEQNLPESIYKAIIRDPYEKKSDFTASELPVPTQVRILRHRYDKLIEVDVADLIYPLIGNNTHYILERMGIKNALQEERFYYTVAGKLISGQIDYYSAERIVTDYKITTRFVLIDGVKPEWEKQLNICRYLMEKNGFKVEGINVCCIFRDWSKIQSLKDPDYPKHQVVILPVKLWEPDRAAEYITERIIEYETDYELPDSELTECTPEERWEKPTKYAIMKKGAKRATKLFDNEIFAEDYLVTLDGNFSIEERPGESTRCEYYCEVKDFCHQYKRIKEDK